MELLRWKTRISVLWIIKALCYVAYWLVLLGEPGAIKGLMAGEIEGMQISEGLLFFYSLIALFIPFIMAWLSLTLKDSANRWTNFVLGILLAIFLVYGLITMGAEPVTILVAEIFDLVALALIVWYAWKWPKQEA